MAPDDTADRADAADRIEIVILEARAVDEMVGKIRQAAKAAGADEAVEAWRAEHGDEAMREKGHDHAVVNQTLMYLHDAPDGMLVPHAMYPDGTEKVYTDVEHAESAF
jgi:hypothetical protein